MPLTSFALCDPGQKAWEGLRLSHWVQISKDNEQYRGSWNHILGQRRLELSGPIRPLVDDQDVDRYILEIWGRTGNSEGPEVYPPSHLIAYM